MVGVWPAGGDKIAADGDGILTSSMLTFSIVATLTAR